jgi:nicotinamidase-related amidase
MNPQGTALLLVGYQNDYFSTNGKLVPILENPLDVSQVLQNTVRLLDQLGNTPLLILASSMTFSADYSELDEVGETAGILDAVQALQALQRGTFGGSLIANLEPFNNRITQLPERKHFNAFEDGHLHSILQEWEIRNVVLTGAVASICVDATAKAAHALGYDVSILGDCVSARTRFERQFYIDHMFPLYSRVQSHTELLHCLGIWV